MFITRSFAPFPSQIFVLFITFSRISHKFLHEFNGGNKDIVEIHFFFLRICQIQLRANTNQCLRCLCDVQRPLERWHVQGSHTWRIRLTLRRPVTFVTESGTQAAASCRRWRCAGSDNEPAAGRLSCCLWRFCSLEETDESGGDFSQCFSLPSQLALARDELKLAVSWI